MLSFLPNKNNRGSALILSMIITVIIALIAIYLLDKIVPFSRDIKGVENGNVAYYRANTALNEALLSMSATDPGLQPSSSALSNGSGMAYKVTAQGTRTPQEGYGNDEYDKDWSVLAPGKPLQLVLTNNLIWTDTSSTNDSKFRFSVPDLNRDTLSNETLLGTTTPIINWTLSVRGGATLLASGSQIRWGDLNSPIFLWNLNGRTLSWSSSTFSNFYDANCGAGSVCTLKFSLISPLLLDDNVTVAPYLQFYGEFNRPTPLQTAVIETEGYAWGFRKNITRYIQQTTTNEALDFTVFQ